MPQVSVARLTVILIIGAALACVSGYSAVLWLDAPFLLYSPEPCKRQCQPVIRWLESYHSKNGRYPQTLPGKYQAILDQMSPKGCHSVSEDGSECGIRIGTYVTDWFLLRWSSTDKRWDLDA